MDESQHKEKMKFVLQEMIYTVNVCRAMPFSKSELPEDFGLPLPDVLYNPEYVAYNIARAEQLALLDAIRFLRDREYFYYVREGNNGFTWAETLVMMFNHFSQVPGVDFHDLHDLFFDEEPNYESIESLCNDDLNDDDSDEDSADAYYNQD
jgi:hypothetical protein